MLSQKDQSYSIDNFNFLKSNQTFFYKFYRILCYVCTEDNRKLMDDLEQMKKSGKKCIKNKDNETILTLNKRFICDIFTSTSKLA